MAKDKDAWKLILEEARDPAWTLQPVERERDRVNFMTPCVSLKHVHSLKANFKYFT